MTHEQFATRIISILPDSYDVRELAKAIAKVLNDEYGSHNYDLFTQVLTKNLKNNGN